MRAAVVNSVGGGFQHRRHFDRSSDRARGAWSTSGRRSVPNGSDDRVRRPRICDALGSSDMKWPASSPPSDPRSPK